MGLPETDICVRLFSNFKELYGIFSRFSQDAALKAQFKRNRHRTIRNYEPGETVFRRLPKVARLPKHLFSSPTTGPYVVVRQYTSSSVVLKDPITGKMVDGGANIPLDQILGGPVRNPLIWEKDNEVRSAGQMLDEVHKGVLDAHGDKRVGPRLGWGKLAPGAYVAYQQQIGSAPSARKLSVGKNHPMCPSNLPARAMGKYFWVVIGVFKNSSRMRSGLSCTIGVCELSCGIIQELSHS